MSRYNVKVYGTIDPLLPQEFSVDNVVSVDDLGKVNTNGLSGPLLVYNPSSTAALLITPTSDQNANKPS